MRKRIIMIALSAALMAFIGLNLGHLTDNLRFLESLGRPVFHQETVVRYAEMYDEDPLLVLSIIKVESNFLSKARSTRGAVGLMQIMPTTAMEIAEELKMADFKLKDLEDPDHNIRFGSFYLSKLRKEFGTDDVALLSAYNAGRKNAKKWLAKSQKGKLALNNIEFAETRSFVSQVLNTYRWLKTFRSWRKKIFGRQR